MEDSAGKHGLHMLAASWPAGSGLPKVCVSHHRRGWEWPRCLGAEAEGHLGAFEQVRMRMKSETSESSSTLPGGPGVVLWSLVKLVKREDVIVDEYDLSVSYLTVTLTETLGHSFWSTSSSSRSEHRGMLNTLDTFVVSHCAWHKKSGIHWNSYLKN